MSVAAVLGGVDDPTAADLDPMLDLAGRLARAAAFAWSMAFGGDDLGTIELPPTVASPEDQANLHSVASLYLASELEGAGLVPAAEMLVGVVVSGAFSGDVGTAAPLIRSAWRERHRRFTAEERRAFFTRLFGDGGHAGPALPGGSNREFEGLLLDLAAALAELQGQLAGSYRPGATTGLRSAAWRLATNVSPRSAGIPRIAGEELVESIKTALELFRNHDVQRALGVRSVWHAVQEVGRRYMGRLPDVRSHVERGRAGMLLLAWLADALPMLDRLALQAPPGQQVVDAAVAWLQASLDLQEGFEGATRSRR